MFFWNPDSCMTRQDDGDDVQRVFAKKTLLAFFICVIELGCRDNQSSPADQGFQHCKSVKVTEAALRGCPSNYRIGKGSDTSTFLRSYLALGSDKIRKSYRLS